MTMLRAPIAAAIVSAVLSTALASAALADGRADWNGYAWKTMAIADCKSDGSALVCPLYHQKWDWKRNQWVDIAISITSDRMLVRQELTDRDPNDTDRVCVTAIVVDAADRNILVHHQNLRMEPGDVKQEDFIYSSAHLADATRIHIGSKQCRDGRREDDDVYASVLAEIER